MRLFGNPVRGFIGPLGKPDPVSGFVVTRGFGNKDFPQFGDHDGLDIDNGGPRGDAILAMDDGVVATSYTDNYGAKVVRIRHRDGWSTGYAHMDRVDVRTGQTVRKGQQIGTLGATGYVTGPHLHFDTEDERGVRHDPWRILEQNHMFKPRNPIVTQDWDVVPGTASTFTRPDGTTGHFTSKERVRSVAEGTFNGKDYRLLDYGSNHEALLMPRAGLTNPGPRIVGSPSTDGMVAKSTYDALVRRFRGIKAKIAALAADVADD